jgi:hypothetical protein
MKKVCLLSIALLLFAHLFSQTTSLEGAWQRNRDTLTTVWIIAEGYFMRANYTMDGNRFVSASGGIFKQLTSSIEVEVEFNSANKNDVGSYHLYDFTLSGDVLTTRHHEEEHKWTRVDDGKPGALLGAWLFSGRKTNPTDDLAPYTPGVRKTMKIMSGTRFQWAAYNTETKEFLGTGGGTYTTSDGKYIENIDVFSRDNSRIGASLHFEMKIEEPHWYHTGKSSKGDMIYERWSRRKSFDNQ